MNETGSGATVTPQQKTILIIDDDLFVRESLSEFFEDREFKVFSAEDGRSGLDIFFQNSIDTVITDLRMPGTDGIAVMRAIHRHSPDVPMIVISGAGEKEDIIKALRMGAKDFITKPIADLEMIEHTVEKVLENRRLNIENRRYRQQIEKSEKQYRTITENIAEGVFTTDAENRFTYVNHAFCRMTGYFGSELINKNLRDITAQNSLVEMDRQTMRLKNESISRFEMQLTDKNGSYLHVELACSSLLDENDEYQGAIAVVRDITQLVSLREKYKAFLRPDGDGKSSVLSICASCKNIRVKKGKWIPVENYFDTAKFSHGICPGCCTKLYPDFDFSELESDNSES